MTSAVHELLRQYGTALHYAAGMPILGRSAAKEGWPRARWGSRFYTRSYVETHVRKQLQAIPDCLRLESMGAGEVRTKRIVALDDELERHVEPLFRWRRLVGLFARLPPVAAAVPILSAASVWPLAEDVSAGTVFDAFLVLVGTALALWILVVWPSVRLGFRVKRVIFAGGSDLRRPLTNPDSEVGWEGFRLYDPEKPGGSRTPFPEINVYEAENDVFRALRRRKPAEIPLDMVLGLTPYLWTAYSVFFIYGLIDVIVQGELRETFSEGVSGLLIAAALACVPFFFPRNARKSYRRRAH